MQISTRVGVVQDMVVSFSNARGPHRLGQLRHRMRGKIKGNGRGGNRSFARRLPGLSHGPPYTRLFAALSFHAGWSRGIVFHSRVGGEPATPRSANEKP